MRIRRIFSIAVSQPGRPRLFENFAAGLPSTGWSFHSGSAGRIRVIDGQLRMDATGDFALNEAILHLDLQGHTNVNFKFDMGNAGDEPHDDGLAVGDTFTSHRNADLVAVSDDGDNWYVAQLLAGSGTFELDLDQIAAAAGITLGENFQIKLQQFDDSNFSIDGRSFDNIDVNSGELTLLLGSGAIDEGDGATATTATLILIKSDLTSELVVDLSSSDAGEITLPAQVTIPAN